MSQHGTVRSHKGPGIKACGAAKNASAEHWATTAADNVGVAVLNLLLYFEHNLLHAKPSCHACMAS